MAGQAAEAGNETIAVGAKRAGRRRMLAATATLVAGLLAKNATDAPKVAATSYVILGGPSATTTATQVGNSDTANPASGAALAGTRAPYSINPDNYPATGVLGFCSGGRGVTGDSGTYGYGVYGSNDVGFGVFGVTLGGTGVHGESGSSIGVQGQIPMPSSAANAVAVYGLNQSTGAGGVGVRGDCATGTGVFGQSATNIGVYGTTGNGSYAVAGHAYQNVGVYGLSEGGAYPYGVLGQVNAAGGYALFGNASADGAVAFGSQAYGNALAGQFIGPVRHYGQILLQEQTSGTAINAFIVGPGVTKNAAVAMPDGSHGLMHCVEAPEPWFEDFGRGTLVAGKAEVKLDAEFAHTVNTDTLHVFLTPHDETHHLAVKATGAAGFSVAADVSGAAFARGVKASDLNGTFTYRVVAKRRDVKGDRLMRVELPKPIEAKIPPIPPIPKAPPAPKLPPMPPARTP